jgi:hypothetical protein
VTRIVDRGAIVAAYVGIGMAITIAVSFLLVIPIEPIYWLLVVPAGLTIGYYANSRSNRTAGPWGRILANGLFAGFVTGLTLAVLLLGVKGLFFFADNGYPDFNRVDEDGNPIPPFCDPGAGCVYARYLADGRGDVLAAEGVTDAASFTPFYWNQQFATAGILLVLTSGAGLGGALLYGLARPRGAEAEATGSASEKASPA